jgi:hypothetical protein
MPTLGIRVKSSPRLYVGGAVNAPNQNCQVVLELTSPLFFIPSIGIFPSFPSQVQKLLGVLVADHLLRRLGDLQSFQPRNV